MLAVADGCDGSALTCSCDPSTVRPTPAGSAESYASILKAEASKNWQGTVPAVQLSGSGGQGAAPVLVLPAEALKPAAAVTPTAQ